LFLEEKLAGASKFLVVSRMRSPVLAFTTASRAATREKGTSCKTAQCVAGDLQIETPPDRERTFEQQLVPKRQVQLARIKGKILAQCAKGMIKQDIESTLMNFCAVTISCTPIAR